MSKNPLLANQEKLEEYPPSLYIEFGGAEQKD